VFYWRIRGTAIVDSLNGVLVVSENSKTYYLPGGSVRLGESFKRTVIRELREETGLKAIDTSYLFDYKDNYLRKDREGDYFRDSHKVFLTTSTGTAIPSMEIESLAYFKGSNAHVSSATRRIIEKYYAVKNPQVRHADTRFSNCGAQMIRDPLSMNIKCDYCGVIYLLEPQPMSQRS
jgi:DNA-directed RNA polymerase subunit RPC12/RpoP